MREDVCYRCSADVKTVYNAYLKAAQSPPFERTCSQEPFHTFSFGVNYSFKYNMNGGSCILHFIPYEGGTAIDLRFVIAQAWGAKCEKYAQELTDRAAAYLSEKPRRCTISIDAFTDENNKVYEHKPVIVAEAAPVPAPAPTATATAFCATCGRAIQANDQFCSGCGTKLKKAQKFCTQCGTPADPDAAFCCRCGTKL